MIIGSRNIVPFRIFRMVPLGEGYFFSKLNSFTLLSSGVMVAHLTPTLFSLIAFPASVVTLSLVLSLFLIPKSYSSNFISKYGRISCFLIFSHITRAISSPLISTTGFLTRILDIIKPFFNFTKTYKFNIFKHGFFI